MELISQDGFAFVFRWLHVLAGIAWIGLLYYFNFVQVPAFAAFTDAGARNMAIDKLARRALDWFRFAMLATVATGLLIIIVTENYASDGPGGIGWGQAPGTSILTGMLLALTMAYNVWMVIWKNQKVVLANAAGLLEGKPADPNAAAAGRRALMASRQNAMFSLAMLFFMVFTSHYSGAYDTSGGAKVVYWIIVLVIWAVLEANALGFMPWKTEAGKGLNWFYESVNNVIYGAVGLWVVLWLLWEILFQG